MLKEICNDFDSFIQLLSVGCMILMKSPFEIKKKNCLSKVVVSWSHVLNDLLF
jgi:hypothetical protein